MDSMKKPWIAFLCVLALGALLDFTSCRPFSEDPKAEYEVLECYASNGTPLFQGCGEEARDIHATGTYSRFHEVYIQNAICVRRLVDVCPDGYARPDDNHR